MHKKGIGKKNTEEELFPILCLSKKTVNFEADQLVSLTGANRMCRQAGSRCRTPSAWGPGEAEGGLWALGGKFPQQRAGV